VFLVLRWGVLTCILFLGSEVWFLSFLSGVLLGQVLVCLMCGRTGGVRY
jgi:hypothetical protein